jgi:hypothetical protein
MHTRTHTHKIERGEESVNVLKKKKWMLGMGPQSYNADNFSALLSVLYKPNERHFLTKEQQNIAR